MRNNLHLDPEEWYDILIIPYLDAVKKYHEYESVRKYAFGTVLKNNLQCTCKACNEFKGSILPDDFMERITEIFIYQTGIKQGNRLLWKITHRLLNRLI